MPFAIVAVIAAAALAYYLWKIRIPSLPHTAGDWASATSDDPRIAVAAMLCMVAAEDGPLTAAEEKHIRSLLESKIGLTPDLARTCLKGGKNLSRRLSGDLTSRLHQLRAPIARHCDAKEKQDVIDMLHAVAGNSAERLIGVRNALGRISASLVVG